MYQNKHVALLDICICSFFLVLVFSVFMNREVFLFGFFLCGFFSLCWFFWVFSFVGGGLGWFFFGWFCGVYWFVWGLVRCRKKYTSSLAAVFLLPCLQDMPF